MKGKILLALTLLLGVSTTTWAVGNLGKANQKKHAYTNEIRPIRVLLTVAMEQRLSGVSLFIGIWQ